MERAPGGEDRWLIHEISSFNVLVKRRSFPEEASEALREALDIILSFSISLSLSTRPRSYPSVPRLSSSSFQDVSTDPFKTDAKDVSRQQPSSSDA